MFKELLTWCNYLKISSKEKGIISFAPSTWFKGQKFLIKEIFKEIQSNSPVRDFIVLKARQLGVTTVVFALDLFWIMSNPAIRLAFLCHNYEVRPKLRENLRTLYLSLPRGYKMPVLMDNREMMSFANNSEILFYHISSKEASRQAVARSQAITCLHASEAAYYDTLDPNEEVLKSLQISRAKSHPARFTILESTANGFNSFYDRWQNAKENPAEKAVFIGWWMRDDYILKPDNPLFFEYNYPPTREEKTKIKRVKQLYGYDININQLAWFRNELATTYSGDLDFALQELPFDEYDAFRLSGYRFFENAQLTDIRREIEKENVYYLNIFADLNGISIEEGSKYKCNLEVYEFPKQGEHYFLGADPTFGSSADSDNAVITIWKGYQDKIIQVAEYVDNLIGTIEFSKIIVLLCGLYRPSFLNLEVTGPGRVVIKELDKIKNKTFELGEVRINISNKTYDVKNLYENIKEIRDYLYYRPDSLRRSFARHWETNQSTKEPLMNQMRSIFGLGMCLPKSKKLLEEMSYFVKDGAHLGAMPGRYDDRVIAAALAIEYWRTYWSHRLPKYEEQVKRVEESKSRQVLEQIGIIEQLKPFIEVRA